MSYQERLNRVNKLKEWGCEQAHDLISFYNLTKIDYENLNRSVKNYICRAMDISFFDDDEKFVYEMDKSRNLKNITPNGAVVPKRDYMLEYNIFLREWKNIMKKIVSPKPEMLNRLRLTPNIRIKFQEEIEENKNRALNTALPHSDGWLEGPWGMNCFAPLFGDTDNNTLRYYEPNKEDFSEDFVQINPSYKDMQWVMDYYSPIKFVPKKSKVYFSDYSMIHNTYKYKPNAGTRVSIDTTLYIGENPPHPDREKEYEKTFIDLGVNYIVDPGKFADEIISEKKTTFSHYTGEARKVIKLF